MKKVIIYSTPVCPYCNLVKDFFKENNISYEDFNVAENQNKAKEMIEKTGQMGVPVIIISEEGKEKEDIIIGFDREKISEIFEIKE